MYVYANTLSLVQLESCMEKVATALAIIAVLFVYSAKDGLSATDLSPAAVVRLDVWFTVKCARRGPSHTHTHPLHLRVLENIVSSMF